MGPYESLTDKMEFIARMLVPYAVLAMIFILSVVSVPYPLAVFFQAPLLLMAIYYWSVYRPTLLPPWLVFAIGLLLDLITGMPYLGLSAILFLLGRIVVVDQRRFLTGQSFMVIWMGFAALAALFHIFQWSMSCLLSLQWMPVRDFVSSYVLGIVLFPVLYLFLHLSHKILPAPISRSKTRIGSQKTDMTL